MSASVTAAVSHATTKHTGGLTVEARHVDRERVVDVGVGEKLFEMRARQVDLLLLRCRRLMIEGVHRHDFRFTGQDRIVTSRTGNAKDDAAVDGRTVEPQSLDLSVARPAHRALAVPPGSQRQQHPVQPGRRIAVVVQFEVTAVHVIEAREYQGPVARKNFGDHDRSAASTHQCHVNAARRGWREHHLAASREHRGFAISRRETATSSSAVSVDDRHSRVIHRLPASRQTHAPCHRRPAASVGWSHLLPLCSTAVLRTGSLRARRQSSRTTTRRSLLRPP